MIVVTFRMFSDCSSKIDFRLGSRSFLEVYGRENSLGSILARCVCIGVYERARLENLEDLSFDSLMNIFLF